MSVTEKVERARFFETSLGSPHAAGNLFGLERCQADDESESFPTERIQVLTKLGIGAYMVPESYGGKLRSYDDAFEPVKCLGRRDMNSVFALGKNLLGSLPAYLFGPEDHKKSVSELLLGGRFVSLAFTEKENGSDLLATRTTAHKTDQGWELNGGKWLINNLAIADAAYVLARTNPTGGPLGFGLFLANLKRHTGHVDFGPRIKLLGGRGMLMGSATFKHFPVASADALGETAGFQQALKIFQVSRGLCASMAAGAVETSLRLTCEFTLKRHLYGSPLSQNQVQRQRLAECYARFQLLDVCAYVASRAVSLLPQELSVVSAFAKFYIPTQFEGIMRDLAVGLGARYYLREGWYEGFFQRATRDVPLVSLFDGSTQVNLYILAGQLGQLLKGESCHADVSPCFDLNRSLPPLDFSKLQLTNRGENSLLASLAGESWVRTQLKELQSSVAQAQDEAQKFQLAERYAKIMALACLEGNQAWGAKLSASSYGYLQGLLRSDITGEHSDQALASAVFEELAAKVQTDRNLGILDYQVAPFFLAQKEQNFG